MQDSWRDARSGRVAVVTDALANPSPGTGVDVLSVLAAEGWGAVLLPPDEAVGLLDAVDEQVREFLRNDMTVVVVGDAAFRPELPRVDPSSSDDLAAFLRRQA